MNDRVLVLNQDYSPLMVCSVERAFVLVFLNKSELIKAWDKKLRTVDRSFPLPSVIRLNRYINMPFKAVSLTRHHVFQRDGFECQYCGSRKDLTLDHVVPTSRGGAHAWNNVTTACRKCNHHKGDQTPEEAGMELRRRPVRPSHAVFLKDYLFNHRGFWDEFLT